MSRISDVLRSAIWLVPALCVAVAILLAVVLIVVDENLRPSGGVLLFPGPPGGARSFLSSIVTAMISFTGTVISVTIVVLQLSSGQFSPRVLRHFLRDRTIQFSIGVFVATFAYALVVLRAVKGGSGTGQANFVPRVAVTGAFALVLASVGMFIAYIGHVTNMIRVANIIASIGADTRAVLSRPDPGGPPDGDGPDPPCRGTIPCPRPGVVVSVNAARLVSLAAERGCVLRLTVRIGDFLPKGAALLEVLGDAGASASAEARAGTGAGAEAGADDADWRRWTAAVCRYVAFDVEPTMEQDTAFGFRQLVDIALQALSPSVNAPTTAAQVIDETHDLLRRLVTGPRRGSCYRDEDGEVRLVVPQYDVDDYLRLVITEIWHYGHDSPRIPERLCRMLDDLHAAARPEYHPSIDAWRARVSRPASQPGTGT